MDYSKLKIPTHIGIIVDGNGRWGMERGLSRSEGHKEGFMNVMRLLKYSYSKKVKCVSAYLFSTENFKRSKKEVDFIMGLLTGKLKDILKFCHDEKIKAVFSGRRDNLSSKIIKAIEKIESETNDYKDRIFNICFNYGGHLEIIDATKKIVLDSVEGVLDINELDEEKFSKYLYQDLPPVDLMIRTSGEQRLSNFMLWQCSYAEFYFPKVYFPDFNEEEFDKAILEYTKRDRRFGGIDYEEKSN
ncbi:MAG: di-trans,poly-cis-decaprenylcistransferase [Bacilli bacterium]|nr:di-trans,poly-cis-decaprenylcistransferase [Bacilli bacterium]